MAESRRVRKQTYSRKSKPDRGQGALYDMCLEFVEKNSSLALDDSFDRHQLAESMVDFIAPLLQWVRDDRP